MLQEFWRSLPPATRHRLAMGSVGPGHLASTAELAMAEGRQDLALELQIAAWEQNPLDGRRAAKALATGANNAYPALGRLLQAVVTAWRPTDGGEQLRQLARGGAYDKALALVSQGLDADPGNLFWCQQLVELVLLAGRYDEAIQRVLAAPVLQQAALAPLAAYLQGESLFEQQQWDAAAEVWAGPELQPLAGEWLGVSLRRAEALLFSRRREHALELWQQALQQRPWDVSLLLRAYALVAPLPEANFLPPTAVLLVARDGEQVLDATLQALATSNGVERILTLDSGSKDRTSELLQGWQQHLGNEALELHTLPLDIGVPAARNWLAALPSLKDVDCVAFVAQDIVVPADWLEKLHAARQAYPEATSWGCQVLRDDAPALSESVATHLVLDVAPGDEPKLDFDLRRVHAAPFRLSELQHALPRRGQFHGLQPCLSVSGDCRLLDREELQNGGFDLRFSPGGLEDAERDLRRGVQGGFCHYHGALTVRRQALGTQQENAAEKGIRLGNSYKLANRFEEQELRDLYARQRQLLSDDLEARFAGLEQALGLKHG